MCVMLSAKSGGNAPLAAFNAVLSNTLAVIYTPLLLGMLTVVDPKMSQFRLAVGCVHDKHPLLQFVCGGAWHDSELCCVDGTVIIVAELRLASYSNPEVSLV
jgi:hypothetical protein